MTHRDNQQQTASDMEIGWIAGIIDGEGSITMSVSKRADRTQVLRITPRVTITNTDSAIIERSVKILDKLGIGKHVRHTKPNNVGMFRNASKDITYVSVEGFRRLNNLLPVLAWSLAGEKKLRAEKLHAFIKRRVDMASNLNCGGNYHYDETDVAMMLDFLRLTKTKNYDHVSRMLNEYTQSTRSKKRVMMYSELGGNVERMPETAPAA